jgi:hypothetical protein
MHYSPTTGQNIPDAAEQRDMDLADDDIKTIVGLKKDLNAILHQIGHLIDNGTLHITHKLVKECGECMHEQLDEMLTRDYNRLTEISASAFWPTSIAQKKEAL